MASSSSITPSSVKKDRGDEEQDSSSSFTTPSSMEKYDVFLCSTGEDTRHSFTRHLCDVLRANKISTFTYDRLQRGDRMSKGIHNAIERSRISVIIFSKGYASSRWCLYELVQIIECRKKYNQIVIPVYYDIEPSQVRNQTGPFAAAFKNHKARFARFVDSVDLVQIWRDALRQVANVAGFNLSEFKSEATLKWKIVNDILKKLGRLSIGDILNRYGVHKNENALYVDVVNFIKQRGHKDEEEDSRDEDKEAIDDDNENIREKDSGHNDEEALVHDIVNIIKQYSGHKDEDELHSDILDILNRYRAHKEHLSYIPNIIKLNIGNKKAIHDVFLSCSDEHSPHSFTTHLYDVLLGKKISTFIDDSRLQRGDKISSALLNAIEDSRISLIIFSKAYAGSRLCLDKLVQILDCREKYKQIVIPVFYDIDPSDVRHQTGPLAEAFKNLEASFDGTSSVQKWRDALRQAANLPGSYNLSDFKSEAALTHVIIDEILKKLDKEAIHETKPSSSNIGESDSSHKDEESDDNKYTGGQNRGDGEGAGGEEMIRDPKRFQWMTAERMFASTNFILEILAVVFDELSSVHKPKYALPSMLMSSAILFICTFQLVYEGRKGEVGWKRKGKIPWLYYLPSDKPFGTVLDFVGLLCAIFQTIFTAVQYASYRGNFNVPFKISNIWPLFFSFCLVCSTFRKKSPKEEASTESTVRAVDNV